MDTFIEIFKYQLSLLAFFYHLIVSAFFCLSESAVFRKSPHYLKSQVQHVHDSKSVCFERVQMKHNLFSDLSEWQAPRALETMHYHGAIDGNDQKAQTLRNARTHPKFHETEGVKIKKKKKKKNGRDFRECSNPRINNARAGPRRFVKTTRLLLGSFGFRRNRKWDGLDPRTGTALHPEQAARAGEVAALGLLHISVWKQKWFGRCQRRAKVRPQVNNAADRAQGFRSPRSW